MRANYPIQTIQPFSEDGVTGFDLEYTLADGRKAKVALRDNHPAWRRIQSITAEKTPLIRIIAHNHELLPIRTLDCEIEEILLPIST